MVATLLLFGAVLTARPAPAAAAACAPSGTENVATDKPSYRPGETVFITGTGYAPACDVTLDVYHPGWSVDTYTVATDTNGRLAFSFDMGTAEGQYFVAISGDADTGLGAAPLSNGPVVLTNEKTKQISFFAKTGDFDECQLDKSGQWLVIKEQVDGAKGEDNVIVNLQTGQQTRFLDQAGAAGHSNDGYGCMVAADNWNPCRGRCGCGTSISPSHPPSRGRRRRGCSCITPRTGRRTSAISPTPMPGPTCLRTSSTCAEAPQATVARRHRPPETGNTVKDNKASSNTQGGFDLSGSGQKLTGTQSNHAAGAFDYRISVTSAVSAPSGNKATAARSPPEASATASSRTRRCGVGFARPRDARGGGAADRHDPVGEGPGHPQAAPTTNRATLPYRPFSRGLE